MDSLCMCVLGLMGVLVVHDTKGSFKKHLRLRL